MFRMNRCYDRPMNYSAESSFKYSSTGMGMGASEYPQAVPEGNMMHMDGMDMNMGMMGCQMTPVYECPQERVCHKEFVHEVPQE